MGQGGVTAADAEHRPTAGSGVHRRHGRGRDGRGGGSTDWSDRGRQPQRRRSRGRREPELHVRVAGQVLGVDEADPVPTLLLGAPRKRGRVAPGIPAPDDQISNGGGATRQEHTGRGSSVRRVERPTGDKAEAGRQALSALRRRCRTSRRRASMSATPSCWHRFPKSAWSGAAGWRGPPKWADDLAAHRGRAERPRTSRRTPAVGPHTARTVGHPAAINAGWTDGAHPIRVIPERLAVMFTDLEGFTRYTARRGDDAAAALLTEHNRIVGPIIRSRGGRVVKRLGDGTAAHLCRVRRGRAPAARARGQLDPARCACGPVSMSAT